MPFALPFTLSFLSGVVAFVCRICVVDVKESVGSVLMASVSIQTMAQNELLLFLISIFAWVCVSSAVFSRLLKFC